MEEENVALKKTNDRCEDRRLAVHNTVYVEEN